MFYFIKPNGRNIRVHKYRGRKRDTHNRTEGMTSRYKGVESGKETVRVILVADKVINPAARIHVVN